MVKIDSNGQQEWNVSFGDTGKDSSRSVIQLSDGSSVVAGSTVSSPTQTMDMWLFKVQMTEQVTTTNTVPTTTPTSTTTSIDNGTFVLVRS
jgi:hypothetical protein